jgi:hypothetical protein
VFVNINHTRELKNLSYKDNHFWANLNICY